MAKKHITVITCQHMTPDEARAYLRTAERQGLEVHAYWNHGPEPELNHNNKFGGCELDHDGHIMAWYEDSSY